MKKLFIYYSHTGNGDKVAEKFKENGYEIRKVIAKKKMPKSFFLQMMVGGFLAGINAKDKLVDYNPDISEFDQVVIGSPIWNGRFPPATNGIIDQTNLEGKKLSFVLYSGSGTGPKAEKRIKELFGDVFIFFLKSPKNDEKEMEKLDVLFK